MAGQRQVYDQYMNVGHGFAWDQQWDKAIAAYARALQEVPEDPESHKYLGLALLEAKRYADALKVYMRAHQIAPDDPVPLEKSADVLERLGRLKEAAQQYVSVADIYLAQRDIDKAIGNFERATLLTPGLLPIHYRLAQLYERTGRKRAAVLQYLTLAFNFQRAQDKSKALQAIERAKRIEPSNPQVLNAEQAITAGELMVVPQTGEAVTIGKPQGKQDGANGAGALGLGEKPPAAEVSPSFMAGPMGDATEKALASLAEHLLDGGLTMAEAMAIQAIELQKIGEDENAVEMFKRAEQMGIRHPAMYMCLGALLTRLERWDEAEKYLKRVSGEESMAGAAHALGQVYMGLGRAHQAAEMLIRALQMTDVALAMNADEVRELQAFYEGLRGSTQGMQDADLDGVNVQFNRWLTGSDWKVRIPETRRALADKLRPGEVGDLKYYITNTAIVDIVARIDAYVKQGRYTLALEEAYYAIMQEPTSLPIHQRIAQILMEQGRTQDAITKYNIVASAFLARDDRVNAAAILDEVIQVAPTDTSLRLNLIDLLEREGQEQRVLDEYIGLANAYFTVAEIDQARDTYNQALKLAQKLNAPAEKRAEVLYHLADIYAARLDFRQAQRTYEQIRTLLPEDERPRRELIEINYRLNSALEAIKELDGLLRVYASKKRGDLIVNLLEQMVSTRAGDMALHSRLAAVYRQMNRPKDAITQLDALGALQLEAGLYQDACATIRQIIALKPADTSQYKQLLAQLGCA